MTKPIIRKNTKLEEEMYQALKDAKHKHLAAAEVCKGHIERAFDAGYARFRAEEYGAVPTKAPSKSEWLKSEGITE